MQKTLYPRTQLYHEPIHSFLFDRRLYHRTNWDVQQLRNQEHDCQPLPNIAELITQHRCDVKQARGRELLSLEKNPGSSWDSNSEPSDFQSDTLKLTTELPDPSGSGQLEDGISIGPHSNSSCKSLLPACLPLPNLNMLMVGPENQKIKKHRNRKQPNFSLVQNFMNCLPNLQKHFSWILHLCQDVQIVTILYA